MRPLDYLAQAGESIAAAKLRTFLTALGIIIGIGAVITMLAIGQGVSSAVVGTFQDLGANRLWITTAPPTADGEAGRGFGGGMGGLVASRLTVDDAEALRQVGGIAAVAPVIEVPTAIDGPGATLQAVATGTTPAYAEVNGYDLVAGRLFAEGSTEVVLNESAAQALFPEGVPLGSTVSLDQQTFTVVGVLSDESPLTQSGAGFGGARSDAAGDAAESPSARPALYLPVTRALEMAGTEHVSQIMLTVDPPERTAEAMQQVQAALRERHGGVTDFRVISAQELLEGFTQVFDILTVGLAAIAGISLLVGGIGIMNIMLVSVTERTREIGIVKAIGATRTHIVLQFLLEAVLLSLIGGILGLALAWAGTLAAQAALGLPVIVTPTAVALAVGISAAIGLFFGVAPAWRASRLDPIIALRHE